VSSRTFPEFRPKTHVVTIESAPNWMTSGDVVTYYNPKCNTLIVRSLTRSERRWRQWWRRLRAMFTPAQTKEKR
jgi:hypothetical protein